jgi:hypothetical protein
MQLRGNIKLIGETQTVGAKGFQKRELVLTTQEKYPQNILIEFTQDSCAALDRFSTGNFVEVAIDLRGREWTSPQGETKYFNTIRGWKVQEAQTEVTVESHSPDRDEDLPF